MFRNSFITSLTLGVALSLATPAPSPAQFRYSSSSPITNAAPGIQRTINPLANPVNYWQYSQMTGSGPSVGTVSIYNQFGLLGMNNPQAGGTTASTPGSPPPPGVMMSVNYAQMFFPNQQAINNPYSAWPNPYGYPTPYANGFANPYGFGYPYALFNNMNPLVGGQKTFFGNGGDGL
jgi:hypothetical protein